MLRVDSPGGSVTASETIWREVKKARERGKPVVASMGAVAASGGYYVSMGADAIVANPGTITGSIGVVTGKLVARDLKERLGVGSDAVRTNANADAWSINAPFTPEQHAQVEAEADLFYTDFVQRVAEGRHLSVEAVEAVARGRVWTGADALEHGLVDELGGLRAAVRRAKVLAGLDEDAKVRIGRLPGLVGVGVPAASTIFAARGGIVAGCIGRVDHSVGGRDHRAGRAIVDRCQRALGRGVALLASERPADVDDLAERIVVVGSGDLEPVADEQIGPRGTGNIPGFAAQVIDHVAALAGVDQRRHVDVETVLAKLGSLLANPFEVEILQAGHVLGGDRAARARSAR